jgi:hypothetical protein
MCIAGEAAKLKHLELRAGVGTLSNGHTSAVTGVTKRW